MNEGSAAQKSSKFAAVPLDQAFTLTAKSAIGSRLMESRKSTDMAASSSSSSIFSSCSSAAPGGETRLIRYINLLYRRWAYFIADHTIPAIVICILVSIICLVKIVTTPYKNDMTGYVPYGARSRDEYAVQEEFTNHNGKGILLLAVILAKDNGSVLRSEILKEAYEVNELISNNFTMYNHILRKEQTFNEFCLSFCMLNVPIQQFYNGFQVQLELLRSHQPLNDRVHLNYPVSHIYGRAVNIQMNFNGIVLKNDTHLVLPSSNDTMALATAVSSSSSFSSEDYAPLITNMASAKLIKLMYRGERVGDWTVQEARDYEMGIVHYFQDIYKPKHIRLLMLSFDYVDSEITRAGLSMLPYLIVGFIIMAFCSTMSTLISAAYMEQMSFHKIYLAIFACICPFMANATAIGTLLTLGVRYDSILCVTPFLVLAIGVDDAYLMIHAWQRVARECRRHPTKDDCIAYRLAEVLQETGPAILISALTNILADAVGTFTGSPTITILCYGNMLSIFMDYVYQLTFYSAIMCISGRFEIKAEAAHQNIHSIEIGNEKKGTVTSCCGQDPCEFRGHMKGGCTAFLEGYVRLVTNTIFAITVFCLWVIFIVISIFGITRLKIELTPEKLFSQDSPIIETDIILREYQVPEHTLAQFYVSNPGNLSDPIRLQLLNQMVFELEHLNGSWGPDGTNYFIRDFIDYVKNQDEADDDGGPSNGVAVFRDRDLSAFFNWPEYERWRGFVILNETDGHLQRFFFTTAYYGENLKQWPERGKLLNKWRSIIDKYKTFNVSVYMDDGIFLDLIDNMPTDAWQSALGTLVCMAFICFIFLYDTFTVVVVSAAIVSIMTGIIGLVNLMGIDLEPIMMAAMLISMGFSVDIPAHVAYHYNSAGAGSDRRLTVAEKLRICFASVALPALQASTSTSLCVLGLLFIPLYMAQVFVRMMVLCIVLCVVHGLLIIPCILVFIDVVLRFIRRLRRQNRSTVSPAGAKANISS